MINGAYDAAWGVARFDNHNEMRTPFVVVLACEGRIIRVMNVYFGGFRATIENIPSWSAGLSSALQVRNAVFSLTTSRPASFMTSRSSCIVSDTEGNLLPFTS